MEDYTVVGVIAALCIGGVMFFVLKDPDTKKSAEPITSPAPAPRVDLRKDLLENLVREGVDEDQAYDVLAELPHIETSFDVEYWGKVLKDSAETYMGSIASYQRSYDWQNAQLNDLGTGPVHSLFNLLTTTDIENITNYGPLEQLDFTVRPGPTNESVRTVFVQPSELNYGFITVVDNWIMFLKTIEQVTELRMRDPSTTKETLVDGLDDFIVAFFKDKKKLAASELEELITHAGRLDSNNPHDWLVINPTVPAPIDLFTVAVQDKYFHAKRVTLEMIEELLDQAIEKAREYKRYQVTGEWVDKHLVDSGERKTVRDHMIQQLRQGGDFEYESLEEIRTAMLDEGVTFDSIEAMNAQLRAANDPDAVKKVYYDENVAGQLERAFFHQVMYNDY